MSNLGLLQVFIALYLVECVLRVPKGCQAYVQGLWGGFSRRQTAWTLKALWPGGAALLCPEPPLWRRTPPQPAEIEAARAALQAVRGPAEWLNSFGMLLLLSVAAAVWVWRRGPGPWRAEGFLALLALAGLLHALQVGLLARAWRRLRPQQPGRRPAVAVTALSPWASARCADLLWRDALGTVHPLAAGLALLPGPENEALAGDCLRRALSGPESDAQAAEAWRSFMRAQAWDPQAALRPPARQAGAQAWCPCCHVQYRQAAACHDCGTPLQRF